jgi:hypothetical protein
VAERTRAQARGRAAAGAVGARPRGSAAVSAASTDAETAWCQAAAPGSSSTAEVGREGAACRGSPLIRGRRAWWVLLSALAFFSSWAFLRRQSGGRAAWVLSCAFALPFSGRARARFRARAAWKSAPGRARAPAGRQAAGERGALLLFRGGAQGARARRRGEEGAKLSFPRGFGVLLFSVLSWCLCLCACNGGLCVCP